MTAVERHLSHIENRIKYCLKNYRRFRYYEDWDLAEKSLISYYNLVGQAVDAEAHF